MAAPPATDAPAAGAEVASERQPVLSVRNLVKHFPVRSRGVVRRTIGDVVREVGPILNQDGFAPTPAAARFATAADVLAALAADEDTPTPPG